MNIALSRPHWLHHLAAWPDRLRSWSESLPTSGGGKEPIAGGPGPVHQRPADPTPMESTSSHYHIPVMAAEVEHFLEASVGKLFLDGTLGGGGHTERLLELGASVLALDQDTDAIDYARQRLSDHEERVAFIHMNFRHYPQLLAEVGLENELDGLVFDLGISSWQIDSPERGFSFMHDGPLDMRMNRQATLSAADLINTADEEELKRIFRDYGEEPFAGRLANAIARRRRVASFKTTGDLASFTEEVCGRRSGKHPATRIFQALRIAVNDELGALTDALADAHRWLRPGGRLVVITFHSIEDRIVKRFLKHGSQPTLDNPAWVQPRANPDCHFKLVVRKALTPSPEEIAANPRARSAKLRVAERLPHHEKAPTSLA